MRHAEKGLCRGNGQAFFFVNFGQKKKKKKMEPSILHLSYILLFSVENIK